MKKNTMHSIFRLCAIATACLTLAGSIVHGQEKRSVIASAKQKESMNVNQWKQFVQDNVKIDSSVEDVLKFLESRKINHKQLKSNIIGAVVDIERGIIDAHLLTMSFVFSEQNKLLKITFTESHSTL